MKSNLDICYEIKYKQKSEGYTYMIKRTQSKNHNSNSMDMEANTVCLFVP